MKFKKFSKIISVLACASLMTVSLTVPYNSITNTSTAYAVSISDMPSDYQYAADWIWENRISAEQSTARRNTIFDQIIAGKGTINYVVRWQSYKTITLQQRKQLETMLETCYNDWNKWLAGYENWPYDHIEVNIVGWAVLDKSCLLDLQPDEVVYDNLISDYDSTYDTSNGVEEIPDKLPSAPDELSRMYHFDNNIGFDYPGGLENRFDMYLWATQGFPSIGGCGGDWGQRLSDDAYINMLDGTGIHVLEHEVGHGFGMTDFYGGEGESDGFPPGGFPDGGTSIMMAGSSTEITNFDGWMLRYMWTKIKDEESRFDLSETVQTTETTTTTTTTTTSAPIETTTTTTTTTPVIAGDGVSAEFSHPEDNKWTFNANNADYVELTFKGSPYGGISGKLNGTEWDVRFDESDTVTVKIELPENTYDSTIEKTYSGVWSNELGDMTDMSIELTDIKLYYNDTPAETTTKPIETTTKSIETTTQPIETTTIIITTTTTTTAAASETTTTTAETTDTYLAGDVDFNGQIDITDVVIISAYVGNPQKNVISEQGIINGDVHSTGDGITANDALAIQQYLAGIITTL